MRLFVAIYSGVVAIVIVLIAAMIWDVHEFGPLVASSFLIFATFISSVLLTTIIEVWNNTKNKR